MRQQTAYHMRGWHLFGTRMYCEANDKQYRYSTSSIVFFENKNTTVVMMHKHHELPSSWPQSSANMIWPHKHSTNHENGEAKETEDKRKPKRSAQISPFVAVRLFNDISQQNSQHKRTPTAKVHSPMRLFATTVWRGVAADKRQSNDDEGWWMENEKRRRRWCERSLKKT